MYPSTTQLETALYKLQIWLKLFKLATSIVLYQAAFPPDSFTDTSKSLHFILHEFSAFDLPLVTNTFPAPTKELVYQEPLYAYLLFTNISLANSS